MHPPVELENTGFSLLKWSLLAVPLRRERFLFPVFLMSHQFPVRVAVIILVRLISLKIERQPLLWFRGDGLE